MKKALIYIGSFIAAFAIMLLFVFALLTLVVGFISFVAWSLPDISVLGWLHFRILSGIAFLFAALWSFSKENKEFVEETLRAINEK